MNHDDTKPSPRKTPLHGVLAEFDAVDPLMRACVKVRDAGFRRWDAHTPFPVHGLDKAMGIRATRLPWLIFFAGISGLLTALALQYYTNAFDYPFRISGKPTFSLPANIPVMFELTVLFSAFAAIFGCLALNKLPELFNPVFKSPRFRRATSDRFFIYVEKRDPAFELKRFSELMQGCKALSIEEVFHDERGADVAIPKGLPGIVAVLTVITLIPLALIARARESTSALPRIHVIPDDMDSQYKFKPQAMNWFFEDGRASREPPEGTVAAEDIVAEDTYFNGKSGDGWTTAFPAGVALTEATMDRGKERFGIYCAPCHGLSGHGDGMVSRHADKLMEGTWVTPSNFHDDRARALAVGDIYNTITHGVRNMPAYGPQVEVADRWAIVMYVRALQMSQNAPKSAVPAEALPTLP